VKARRRKGSENIVTGLRSILAKNYGDRPVAIGGVFSVLTGKIKVHVMVGLNAAKQNTTFDKYYPQKHKCRTTILSGKHAIFMNVPFH